MTPTEAITALEKALEAGPTPGPWHWEKDYRRLLGNAEKDNEVLARFEEGDLYVPHWATGYANAAFIAAANPLAIRTLLDAHAGALRDAEALRAALRVIAEVTPNGWHKDDGAHVANSFIHSARAALATNTKGAAE